MNKNNIQWNDINENLFENPQKKKVQEKNRIIISIFLAFFSTLVQYILFTKVFGNDQKKDSNNKYAVAIAKKDITIGEIASDENIKFVYIDIGENKDHFILNSEYEIIRGKKILVRTKENTPLLKNSFMSRFQANSYPEKIPFGKRLFVLEVDSSDILSLVQIGDKIDIIAHLQIPDLGKVTETILDGIEIIGIGDQIEHQVQKRRGQSISFYISPEEVKIISFMKQYTHFSISLRNPNDHSTRKGTAVTFNKFMQDARIQKIIKNDSFQIIQGEKH